MTVDRAEIQRIARLAALAVDESALDELTAQIDDILTYVAQLESVSGADDTADAEAYRPGPDCTPLQPDAVDPIPLQHPPGDLAPDYRERLFVVPRPEGVGEGA